MPDTISDLYNKAGCFSRGIEGQDSLVGQVEGRDIEFFKHYLSLSFSVLFGR